MQESIGARGWIGATLAFVAFITGAHAAEIVTLSSAATARLGLRTEPLKAVQHKEEIAAFAKVLDPGPLAQLISDLESQISAARTSAAELKRLRELRRTVSGAAAKDVEAAEAQAASDASKLRLLQRRVGLEWGPGVARLTDAQRRRLLDGLARGTLAIVHIDSPNNKGQDGARTAEIDVGDGSVQAKILGPARTSEPRLQSSGLIGVVAGPQAVKLSTGLTQSAHLAAGGGKEGVLLPGSAVVRYGGSDWTYVQTGAGQFERRQIVDGQPEKEGIFAIRGFRPGELVVVGGVAGLISADRGGPGGRAP